MPDDSPLGQRLWRWGDELWAIANEGLPWSADTPYHLQRYERIRRIAAELMAQQDTRDADQLEHILRGNLQHVAPIPAGDAAIFNQVGDLLLIQRKDNGLWAMPGGLCEVGETPAEGVVREAWEETGLTVTPISLVGVYDSRFRGGLNRFQLYQFVFLCRPGDPAAEPGLSNETLDVGWYAEAALPPLDPNHVRPIADAFARNQGAVHAAVFDWAP